MKNNFIQWRIWADMDYKNLVPMPFLKYEAVSESSCQQFRCRSVNVLNCRPRSSSTIAFSLLSDVNPRDEMIFKKFHHKVNEQIIEVNQW